MEHAKLSPSSSSRWLVCTASVDISEQYENKTNSAAEWGTTVHGIGELMLKGYDVKISDMVEGMKVDKEMLECAEEYVDYCNSLITKDSHILIEERFSLEFIAPDTFGTGDFSCLNDNHLHIVDLKTGRGVVSAQDNTQLKLYALGAIYELETFGHEITDVTLHIVQTRVNHIDTFDITYDELKEFEAFAKKQAEAIRTGKTTFTPTQKGCMWCPHKTNCEALKKHVEDVVVGSFEDLPEIEGSANLIDNSHLKNILDNADLIFDFVKACQSVALEKLQAGEKIEGYKLVASRTNRKISDEAELVKYLENNYEGTNFYQEPKLLPLGKLEKLLKKDEKFKDFIVKPQGSPTLAPITDKRKAISSTCDDFEDLD